MTKLIVVFRNFATHDGILLLPSPLKTHKDAQKRTAFTFTLHCICARKELKLHVAVTEHPNRFRASASQLQSLVPFSFQAVDDGHRTEVNTVRDRNLL
jgi:hypothetical protein